MIGLLAGCVTPQQFYALEDDVRQLEGGGSGQQGQRVAELGQEVAELRQQLAEMQGQIEEARHLAEQAMAGSERMRRAAPDAPATAPEAGRSGELPAVPGAPSSPAVDSEPGARGTDREVQDYEAAFRLYRAGDYAAAAQQFQGFVTRYPRSDYADNALFWIAECHQKQGDFVLAAVTFERVHKEYPEGNKVPDALYRQAVALLEIGKQKGEQEQYASASREVLQRIVDEYPRSERADEARRQLEKLAR